VLAAARTKWNFLPFQPGLVGGHCIGVDPYYLSYRATELGHDPAVILAGRAINDGMAEWIADEIHARAGKCGDALVLGLAFKEDVPDLRNSKVADLISRLDSLGHKVTVHDPLVDTEEAAHEYQLVVDAAALDRTYDVVVLAVAHESYRSFGLHSTAQLVRDGGLLVDLKNLYGGQEQPARINYWTL